MTKFDNEPHITFSEVGEGRLLKLLIHTHAGRHCEDLGIILRVLSLQSVHNITLGLVHMSEKVVSRRMAGNDVGCSACRHLVQLLVEVVGLMKRSATLQTSEDKRATRQIRVGISTR